MPSLVLLSFLVAVVIFPTIFNVKTIPFMHIGILIALLIVPYGLFLILKIVKLRYFKNRTFTSSLLNKFRKPLLIFTILIQISISTYFNYYSFFLINWEIVFILFLIYLSIGFVILILFISPICFNCRKKKKKSPPKTEENAPLNEANGNKVQMTPNNEENNEDSDSETPNYQRKKVLTIAGFLVLQDSEIPFLMIVPNFTSPKDDFANGLVFLLFFFTRLLLLLLLISFVICKKAGNCRNSKNN